MQGIQILLTPFVWIMMLFYNLAQNYGVALILFAVVVKLILFPFQLKSKRSMIQMTMLSDKMQKLQKMYGNNKEKYNEEIQKLYEKEHVNPMSGCLWALIPMFILLPLYAIVRQPFTYMMNLTPDVIQQIATSLDWGNVAVAQGWIKEAAEFVPSMGYNQLYLASLVTPENVQQLAASLGEAGKGLFAVNFGFLGLDLSQIPNLKFWTNGISWGAIGLFLMPFVSAASGFVFSLISMKTNAINNQSQANSSTNKTMLIMQPLMSLWIGFVMPAALCIYWIAQNILSMGQEYLCSKMLKKDYEEAAAKRAEQERLEREEEKERKRQLAEERARRAEEAKQKGKKKTVPKKKAEDDDKIPGTVKEASRVGLRTYARGRAYDPKRFGEGPTAYHEPGAPIDETAVEKALKKKADALEKVAQAAAVDDEIIESIMEEEALLAPAETEDDAGIAEDEAEDGPSGEGKS